MPELGDVHRNATVNQQRQKHREALLTFRRRNPTARRNRFAMHHAGAFDWLRTYDRTWLDANLPDLIAGGRNTKRIARKDWRQADRAAIVAMRAAAKKELEKDSRPTRITRTRLLSAAGALAAMDSKVSRRLPLATAEAERLAEDKAQFLRRVIRWALQQYAGLHVPISTNKLRRVARLPANVLLEQRSYVIEVAKELGAPFDARCSLSPWRDAA